MGNPFNYITMNLTNRCNTYCKYCFQSAKMNDIDYLNYDNVKTILEYVLKNKSSKEKHILHLTGGEPTLNKDFFRILKFAIEHKFIIRIQTNGIGWETFSESELELLKKRNVSLKISLDGWNAETHEYFRAKNSYAKVLSGLETITKYSKMVGIKTCIHKKNINELYKMLDFCLDKRVQGFSYNLLRLEGEVYKNNLKSELNIREIEIAKKLIPYFNQAKYQFLMNGNNLLLYYYTKGNIRYQNHFYIDFDGCVYPHQSCLQEECFGNIFENGYEVMNPNMAIKFGHYHIVDQETVKYVKESFIPQNRLK